MAVKFLLVSQVFYPDEVSTANLFTILSSVLVEDKIDVEVWAANPSYTERKRQPSYVEYHGIQIHYLPSTSFRKESLAGRFFNILTFTLSSSIKILFSGERTPVWTHTTPPFLGIALSFFCSWKNRKFIYILQDIYPEGLVRLGKATMKNPLISLWRYFFIRSLQKSHKIITNGRDLSNWVKNNCRACQGDILYIPNFQDEKTIFPVSFYENEFVIEHNLLNRFIVQYSGNMGLWNEMKTIGKAVSRSPEDVTYIFVGSGIRRRELIEEISEASRDNIIILPFQPVENFNKVLNASHVHLVTLKNDLDGIAVPSKIYGILAAGKPVIALVPDNSEIASIVREEKCGIVVNPEDIEGLLSSIEILKNDESLRNMLGQNAHAAFKKKYTVRIIAGMYKGILAGIQEEDSNSQ